MNHLHSLVLAITLLVGSVSGATAQDLQKGYDAYRAEDYKTALQEFLPLAEQGVALAQGFLGYMYSTGQGVPQDYAKAVKWYRLAAEQGIAKAQTNLGVMYDKGQGVPQDYAEAMTLSLTCGIILGLQMGMNLAEPTEII
jgi:TPR repeat protein